MTTDYGAQDIVPTEILIARLEELSRAVTEGKDAISREFTMRIPAEMDRDADLVLHAAACRLHENIKWQTIEAAPKDGTPVLIYCPNSGERWKVCEAWWSLNYENGPGFWTMPHCPSGRGYMILPEEATHWMPLPPPPNALPTGRLPLDLPDELKQQPDMQGFLRKIGE